MKGKTLCRSLFDYLFDEWLPRHGSRLDSIVLATRWDDPELIPWAERLVEKLAEFGVSTVIVGPPVELKTASTTLIASRYGPLRAHLRLFGGEGEQLALTMPHGNVAESVPEMDAALRRLAARVGASYISPVSVQCKPEGCAVAAPDERGRQSFIQRDRLHYSPSGSRWLASRLSVEELLGKAL